MKDACFQLKYESREYPHGFENMIMSQIFQGDTTSVQKAFISLTSLIRCLVTMAMPGAAGAPHLRRCSVEAGGGGGVRG